MASAPSIVIPAPSAAAGFAAPEANTIFLSSIVSVVLFKVVVVPSTCKLPAIITVPVLSPIAAGSSVKSPDVVPTVLPSSLILSTESTSNVPCAESRSILICGPPARSILVVLTPHPPLINIFSPVTICPVPDGFVSPLAVAITFVSI